MLEFLPDMVDIPDPFEFKQLITDLYRVYERDIKLYDLRYKGLRVFHDDRKVDSDYEEGFWHVIERGKDTRLLDLKRAKRLPWIRPLIETSDDPRLYKWVEAELDKNGQKQEVTLILYREENYIVVLKKRVAKWNYYLASAYYLTGYNRQKYFERYLKAEKKGPGC